MALLIALAMDTKNKNSATLLGWIQCHILYFLSTQVYQHYSPTWDTKKESTDVIATERSKIK